MRVTSDNVAKLYRDNGPITEDDLVFDDNLSVHGPCDQDVAWDKIEKQLKKIKSRKAVGLDGIYLELFMEATGKKLEFWTDCLDRLLGSKNRTE